MSSTYSTTPTTPPRPHLPPPRSHLPPPPNVSPPPNLPPQGKINAAITALRRPTFRSEQLADLHQKMQLLGPPDRQEVPSEVP